MEYSREETPQQTTCCLTITLRLIGFTVFFLFSLISKIFWTKKYVKENFGWSYNPVLEMLNPEIKRKTVHLFNFCNNKRKRSWYAEGLFVITTAMYRPNDYIYIQYVDEWLSVGSRLAFSLVFSQQLTCVSPELNFWIDFRCNYSNKKQQLNI